MDADATSSANEDLSLCEAGSRKLKSYPVSFKLQVVREAKVTSGSTAAKRFWVDPKPVREWVASEDKLLVAPRHRRKTEGGG